MHSALSHGVCSGGTTAAPRWLQTSQALPDNEGKKPLRLGLILGIGRDPDAAMAKVHELGLPTCQVFVDEIELQFAGTCARHSISTELKRRRSWSVDLARKCGTFTRGR